MRFSAEISKCRSGYRSADGKAQRYHSHFGDPLGKIVADARHSATEERLVLLGVTQMYTERDRKIRVISSRKATRREERDYDGAARSIKDRQKR